MLQISHDLRSKLQMQNTGSRNNIRNLQFQQTRPRKQKLCRAEGSLNFLANIVSILTVLSRSACTSIHAGLCSTLHLNQPLNRRLMFYPVPDKFTFLAGTVIIFTSSAIFQSFQTGAWNRYFSRNTCSGMET